MATNKAPEKQTRTVEIEAGLPGLLKLWNEVLDSTDVVNARSAMVRDALIRDDRIEKIEAVLPPGMKGEGKRLAQRAVMYFGASDQLKDCPPEDFVRAVVRAAEMGLALDGRLCYCLKFKDKWVASPDYKGLVAVAKRSGQVVDVKAELVFETDGFDFYHEDGYDHLTHKPKYALKFTDRGPVVAAYACFLLKPAAVGDDAIVRYCVMTAEELEEIRKEAKNKRDDGPWQKWPREMQRKCPIRRGLKLYCDDPGVLSALALEDELSTGDAPAERHPLPEGSLDLSKKNGKQKEAKEAAPREPGQEG